MKFLTKIFTIVFVLMSFSAQAFDRHGINDSRIKTLIYNENQVYTFPVNFGYQANIELSDEESIKTISVGNRSLWQITPSKSRVFLRPLSPAAKTNMSIITDKREYNFDLIALSGDPDPEQDPIYFARFYYPNLNALGPARDFSSEEILSINIQNTQPDAVLAPPAKNYEYSYSGPQTDFVPEKAYDDGKYTYFRFPEQTDPLAIFIVDATGKEVLTKSFVNDEGFVVVEGVSRQFAVRKGAQLICIYNDRF